MWVGHRNSLSLLVAFAGCVLLPFAAEARAQDSQGQQSSVADAARRAKQKKAAAKGSKVIDDDNLGSNLKSGGPDVTNVGASAAATVNPPAAANGAPATGEQAAAKEGDQGATVQDDQGGKEEDPEIAKVKAQVAETEQQLDWLKRGFALDSEAYYSKTDYASDKAGKAKLDDEQQQIAQKQQELEQVKARLAELLEQRGRKKGKITVAPGEKPAATPQQ